MSNTLQTIHPDTVETLMPVEHAETTTHATTEHAGPHIPSSKGEIIPGWSLAGYPITNTIFSTWLFMAVFFVIITVFYTAITTRALP